MTDLCDMMILRREMPDQPSDDPAATDRSAERPGEADGNPAADLDSPDERQQRELQRDLVLRALI